MSKYFPIKSVQVLGKMQYISEVSVKNILNKNISGGFFNINIKTIQQQILNIPGVSSVSIKRIWPDKLLVKLRERQVIAIWKDNFLVSPIGFIFEYSNVGDLTRLPRLYCEKKYLIKVIHMLNMMNKIIYTENNSNLDLKSLSYSSGNVIIKFKNEIINLGSENIFDRLKLFLKYRPMLIEKDIKNTPLKVDMRYPNGFSVI